MSYLIDEKSLRVLQELQQFDKDNLIDWEKTKEKFVYIHSNTNVYLYDKKYGWYDVKTYGFKQGKRHKYHTHGSPEEHFNILKTFDTQKQIDWEKSKEKFVYINNSTRFWLYDKKYEWYEISYNNFKKGTRHTYHRDKSPEEHLEILVNCDVDNWIDWEKTKEKFHYTRGCDKSMFFDKNYGWFKIEPSEFKRGSRHPKRRVGIDYTSSGSLYLLEIQTDIGLAYKIGITNKSVDKRYTKEEQDKFNVLIEQKFDILRDAHNIEQEIKKTFTDYTIDKKHYPLKNGYTETFIGCDINEILNMLM